MYTHTHTPVCLASLIYLSDHHKVTASFVISCPEKIVLEQLYLFKFILILYPPL